MIISWFLSITQIKKLPLNAPPTSATFISASTEPSGIRKRIIFTRLFAKESTSIADGIWISLAISTAVAHSGLIVSDNPISCLINWISSLYSGLRTLATVWQFDAFFAIRQLSRLISSLSVTAINKSACSIPASFNVEYTVQFPSITCTSIIPITFFNNSGAVSINVTSCLSLTSCSPRVVPTFPQPAIIIFILIRYPFP